MRSFIIASLAVLLSMGTRAQVTGATIEASGLTCSLCSKAVLNALTNVPFVEKVIVNIKTQQYELSFKKDAVPDFDLLGKAVENAGFSIATLIVHADVAALKPAKDEHVQIGKQYFHFLNANNQSLNGTVQFTLVDKHFTSAKNFKKFSAFSKMSCVQSGKMAACCTKTSTDQSRIYHVII